MFTSIGCHVVVKNTKGGLIDLHQRDPYIPQNVEDSYSEPPSHPQKKPSKENELGRGRKRESRSSGDRNTEESINSLFSLLALDEEI